MDKNLAAHILEEHLTKGLSHRKLAMRYGISAMRIYRMLRKHKESQKSVPEEAFPEELPDDIKVLKEALRQAKLKLQDLMIDIASKELGVDIRKKSGTRQS